MGRVFAPTRFSLVRISIRDLVADRKSLVRNSGVGGGGSNFDPHAGRSAGKGAVFLFLRNAICNNLDAQW